MFPCVGVRFFGRKSLPLYHKSASSRRFSHGMSNSQRQAVLLCDLQPDILANISPESQKEILEKARKLSQAARAHGVVPIWVRVALRPGYPDVSPNNLIMSGAKQRNVLVDGTPGAAIVPESGINESDIVITKRRVGAFSTTDLRTVLKCEDITKFAIMGVSTSGVVLTTVREAADMDFAITVLSDGCADRNPDAHSALIQHVFPRQANISTCDEWIASLAE